MHLVGDASIAAYSIIAGMFHLAVDDGLYAIINITG